MSLTITEFIQKWNAGFADNEFQNISEATFRAFKDDVAGLVQTSSVGGRPLTELALPMAVLGGGWYLTENGLWEARRDFNASQPPLNGPNWRRVSDYRPAVATADLTDASAAGRQLLTAADCAAQLSLLDTLAIAAGQYGNHPAFTRAYTSQGLLLWLLQAVTRQATVRAPQAPAAPTAGQVDDEGNTFSFVANPAYPSFAQYKVNGLPGVVGAVALDAVNSYAQGGRIYIKVVGAVAKNGLAVYVAGSGIVPDGDVLSNAEPFTGAALVVTPPPANQAPTVNLTGSSSTVNTGQSVTLTAAPYDADGMIAKVEFFDNDAKIGETTAQPHSILTPGLAQGQHNFTSCTTDDKGAVGNSTIFSVAVSTPQQVFNGSYTARCGTDKAGTGPDVTRTAQGNSPAEADAAAHNAAVAALVCTVPVTYEWTLTGPSDQDSTGLTLTTDGAAHQLRYNRIFNGDSAAKRLDLFVAGAQLAVVDFPASYLGQPFAFAAAGVGLAGTFTDGSLTLS